MFWLSLAAAGVLTATAFPARNATQDLLARRAPAAVTIAARPSPSRADPGPIAAESGSLLLLATGLFGAATALARRRP